MTYNWCGELNGSEQRSNDSRMAERSMMINAWMVQVFKSIRNQIKTGERYTIEIYIFSVQIV